MVGRICPPPPGGDRVKVSQNSGVTWVAPVTPLDTSLPMYLKVAKNFKFRLPVYISKTLPVKVK
jgi:hypothetical protein